MTDFPLIEVAMRLKEALRAIAFAQQALDGQDMTPRVKRLYDQLGVMEKMIDDKEIQRRQEFALEESGKNYVSQEL